MNFVELDRTFFPWTEDRSPVDPFLLASLGGSLHWPDILELQRVVILAEAGSEKSEELAKQAAGQQEHGRFGFYATVQDVAVSGLPTALRPEDRKRLSEWKSSAAHAWFFIDSIDEAKLDGIRLESALRQIAAGIEGSTARASIILSGR